MNNLEKKVDYVSNRENSTQVTGMKFIIYIYIHVIDKSSERYDYQIFVSAHGQKFGIAI